jgi:Chondroitinase B
MQEPINKPPRPIHYLDKSGRRGWRGFWLMSAGVGGAVILLMCLLIVVAIESFALTPGMVMRAVLQTTEHMPPTIAAPMRWVAHAILPQDRLDLASATLPAGLGAASSAVLPTAPGSRVPVADVNALLAAVNSAHPGDIIVLAPGHYAISRSTIHLNRPGTDEAPITLTADHPGEVVLESNTVVALHVEAPHWRIENLVIKGVCSDNSQCEHAIQVTGSAYDTQIRNNRLEDFNAQIKINGEGGAFPDRGLIEGNTLTDTAPRATPNPITPIDLVAANDWHIVNNIVADFQRADATTASYGAYAKGAGENNIFERNLIICEWKLHQPGEHIGLSLGGGGTGPDLTRDQGRTGLEQLGGIIRDNVIIACSDDGIYLNKSARSDIDRNTLLDTAGIDARFVETSASITDNIVDGTIRIRNGATATGQGNDTPSILGLFIGRHPQRTYYTHPESLDLTWRREPPPAAVISQATDLCGVARTATAPPGAFVDYKPCLASPTNETVTPKATSR